MTAGTVRNALAAHARLEGSLRAFQDEVFDHLKSGIFSAAKAVEAKYGCRVEITMSQGYPAILNPDRLYDRVKTVVSFRDLAEPSMTSEDFAWYQRQLPGMFFFIGVGDTPALHNDHFDFDDSLLSAGADFFARLAVNFR